jgi:hypothetical protein
MSDEYYDDRSDHSTMDASEYEAEITFLVARHLHHKDNGTMEQLLKALGCRRVAHSGRQCYVQRPKQPAQGNDILIRKVMLLALRCQAKSPEPDDTLGLSILDGLTQNGRWRSCLDCEDDAYALAVNLLTFFACIDNLIETDTNHGSLGLVLLPGPMAVFNEWTSPPIPHEHTPSMEDVVRSLFGDAWWHFVAGQSDVPYWDIAGLVRSQRPPFCPGLVKANHATSNEHLPDLDMS